MKKTGLTIGFSFLAGALFFALTFGFIHDSGDQGLILSPPAAKAQTGNFTMSFAPVVKKVKPAVVQVISEIKRDNRHYGNSLFDRFFGMPDRRRRETDKGMGTGFFISKNGYIITNNHVVQNAVKVSIKDIDDKEFSAKIIGTDASSDLALLKVEGDNFPHIELGDSDTIEVGEWVLAIGNPLGQNLSVTSGIISAKGRHLDGLSDVTVQNFIQTDAAINRGNSGGPLVDMNGKAIGINSVILSTSGGSIGIGFAIPANLARKVINDLKSKGRVVRAYLGISISPIENNKAAQDMELPESGHLVIKVEKDSPAEKAGLKRDDLIVGINGKKIKKNKAMQSRIMQLSPGEKVQLNIYRDKKRMDITIVTEERPGSGTMPGEKSGSRDADFGMVLRNNSRSLARKMELTTAAGIVITEIARGGVAYNSGLKPGDVIYGINNSEVNNIEEFKDIIKSRRPGTIIRMYINRFGDDYYVKFRLPE